MPSRRGVLALLFLLHMVLIGPVEPYRSPQSVNEAATIGDMRSLISAQEGYSSVNHGLYAGDLRCLVTPDSCIAGYGPGRAFLDAEVLGSKPRSGYVWTYYLGAQPPPELTQGLEPAPSSVQRFAATAVPLRPASKYPSGGIGACFKEEATGHRSFCADDTGRICVTTDGSEPRVGDSRCDPCQELR